MTVILPDTLQAPPAVLLVGVHKADITPNALGVGMLGYSYPKNVVEGVATPLYARAFVFEHTSGNAEGLVAYVVADMCFVTDAIKMAVVAQLEEQLPHVFSLHNLMLTAQHTHSAPGGSGQHLFYNLPFEGYVPAVVETYAEGIAAAIAAAYHTRQPARLSFGTTELEPNEELAINRSLDAYNTNPEIRQKLRPDEWHLATDRTMHLLRIDDLEGNLLGTVNWFGIHTTNIPDWNTLICADNKGYAAAYMEDALANATPNPSDDTPTTRPVAAFAQGVCGDVSPNYVWKRERFKPPMRMGKYADPFESARFNGHLQYTAAMELFGKLKPITATTVDSVSAYQDWSQLPAAPNFAFGEVDKRTAPSALGMRFLEGTTEGHGAAPATAALARLADRAVRTYERLTNYTPEAQHRNEAQLPKTVVLEMQARRLLHARRTERFIVPSFLDPHLGMLKKLGKRGLTAVQDWLPHVFQLQIVRIGTLAIVGIPAEVTVVAGARLRTQLTALLAPMGIEHVVLNPYANGYAGYMTTYEEYNLQRYEGGHTPFGKWTLAAVQTALGTLAPLLAIDAHERPKFGYDQPPMLPDEVVWKREG